MTPPRRRSKAPGLMSAGLMQLLVVLAIMGMCSVLVVRAMTDAFERVDGLVGCQAPCDDPGGIIGRSDMGSFEGVGDLESIGVSPDGSMLGSSPTTRR